MKRIKIITDSNCPPGVVYVMNPKLVQTISAKGKVTKPLEQLAAKIMLPKPRSYRPTILEIRAALSAWDETDIGIDWDKRDYADMRRALIAAHKTRETHKGRKP